MDDFSRQTEKLRFFTRFLARNAFFRRFYLPSILIFLVAAVWTFLVTEMFFGGVKNVSAEEPAEVKTTSVSISATKTGSESTPIDLIELLRSPEAVVRITAIEKLAEQGERAQKAVPAMILLLADDAMSKPTPEKPIPEQVYVAVYTALPKIGPVAVSPLLEALKSPNPVIRYRSAMTLGQFETLAPTILPALQNAMHDGDPLVRANAVSSYGRLSTSGETAGPVLAAFLRQEKESGPRFAALSALARLDGSGTIALPHLIEALKDADPQVRFLAVEQLGQYGPKAKMAVPALIVALKDKEVRNGLLDPDDTSAPMPLYYDVMTTLGRIGPDAAEAVPVLKKIFRDDPRPTIRIHAAEAIEKIDPVEAASMKTTVRELKKRAAMVEATEQALDVLKSR